MTMRPRPLHCIVQLKGLDASGEVYSDDDGGAEDDDDPGGGMHSD